MSETIETRLTEKFAAKDAAGAVSYIDIPGGAELQTASGMNIVVAPMKPSGLFRLLEICGNQIPGAPWMRLAQMMMSVNLIDAQLVPPVSRKSDITTIADRLGDEGFAAVTDHFFPPVVSDEQAPEMESAKN